MYNKLLKFAVLSLIAMPMYANAQPSMQERNSPESSRSPEGRPARPQVTSEQIVRMHEEMARMHTQMAAWARANPNATREQHRDEMMRLREASGMPMREKR